MRAFDDLLDLLAGAVTEEDRRAACALVEATGEGAVWLRRWAHRIARGGTGALLREAMAEPPRSPVRAWSQGVLARRPELRPRLSSLGSTRTRRGPVRTFETELSMIGDARFAPDGERIFAFAWGELRGELARRFGELHGSLLLELSLQTGELTRVRKVGQFRDEDGALALSPDGARVALRSHRSTLIVDLASGRRLAELRGCEGPAALRFCDERHLLVLDGSSLELWDTVAGVKVRSVDAVGFHGLALSADGGHVVVTGAGRWAAFAVYQVPTLELAELVPLDLGRAPSVVALHPAGTMVATGDWDARVRTWSRPGGEARELGKHRGWVSALQFVERGQILVSGGWDGQVMAWRATSGERALVLSGHSGYLTALDVHPDDDHFLSCAADGDVRVWQASASQSDAERGESGLTEEPPFSFAYGSHQVECAACVSGDRFLFRVGARALAWSVDAECLGPVPADFAGGPKGPAVSFHRGRLTVDSGGEAEPRVLRLRDGGHGRDGRDGRDRPAGPVLEVAPTGAEPVVMAALDDRLAVLEADGHLTFWQVAAP